MTHDDERAGLSAAHAWTPTNNVTDQRVVLDTVDRLIQAFANHDTAAYFAFFAENASFVFHTHDRRLESTEQYRELWRRWESEDGFHVLDCKSTQRRVDVRGDTAIFTHLVHTTLQFGREDDYTTTRTVERETIVLVRSNVTWVALHEHLSPA